MSTFNKTRFFAVVLAMGVLCSMMSYDALAKPKKIKETAATESDSKKDVYYSWKAYPSTAKTPSEAKLLVEREVPKAVRPGDDYTYEIKVTNRSYYPIDDVVLTEKVPSGFTLLKTSATPEKRGDDLRWNFGMLAPGQTEVISIIGKADKAGKLYHSGNAVVKFKLPQMITMMKVIEPVLQFKVAAPQEVIVSETIPVTMTMRNVGSAPVIDAVLDHTLTKGLSTVDGSGKVFLKIGDINTNEVKTFKLSLRADAVGVYENNFVVKAKDGVTASASMKTFVRKPKLQMTAKAPRKRFVSNFINYDITVKNVGDGVAKSNITKLGIPNGAKFVSANEGGKVKGGQVVWQVASLQPGESKKFQATFKAEQITTAKTTVQSQAIAAETVTASLTTEIAGIPAIFTTVDDINDPVPVGETESYVIKVRNQGSLAASNVIVKCDLEDSMEFVKSSGPTKPTLEANTLTFAPLKELLPQAEAQWVVVVRAKKEGDVRFTVRTVCDQLSGEVKENESTNFYK